MKNKYFFDTYAFIEIAKSSKTYEKYKQDVKIITTKLNLMELAYFLRREKRTNEIKMFFRKLSRFCLPFPDDVYLDAVKMKYLHRKRGLSYIDCLGYCLAKFLKVRFLTGDEKFKDLSNVEFVKGRV